MFGFIKGIAKLTLNVTSTPVDMVKDIVTMGGELTGKDKMYTEKRVDKTMKDFEEDFMEKK